MRSPLVRDRDRTPNAAHKNSRLPSFAICEVCIAGLEIANQRHEGFYPCVRDKVGVDSVLIPTRDLDRSVVWAWYGGFA
jgi:hypothetical protein